MDEILPGKLLIADPFLRDPNFMRSVVFMCEHKDDWKLWLCIKQKI